MVSTVRESKEWLQAGGFSDTVVEWLANRTRLTDRLPHELVVSCFTEAWLERQVAIDQPAGTRMEPVLTLVELEISLLEML